jgi:GH25 family lysozyme M1 (1,4-beta-N-acetylmuramidase)
MGIRFHLAAMALLSAQMLSIGPAAATEFFRPWADPKRAIVLDGYEHNIIDFAKIATDKRVTAFIHKGSDGVPPSYRCKGDDGEKALCRQTWQRHAIAKELYHTRRMLAKQLGLEWGAYHLARAGDPLEQVRHFIDYADPQPDELIALDIEGIDDEKWMSLADAEIFAIYIEQKLGRYPVLYANEIVSRQIAENANRYPILSRLPLWYARYKPAVRNAFPKGNWDSYHIWQFAYQGNCSEKRCPYRVKGTDTDIDVNIVDMTPDQLRKAWPLGALLEDKTPVTIPVPVARPEMPGLSVPVLTAQALWNVAQGTREAIFWRRNKVAAYREYAALRLAQATVPRRGIDHEITASILPPPFNDIF